MADRFMTRVTVFVIVRNEKGEILLQQRGPNSYLGGYWDFPSGHAELGEALRDTAVRELYEEVGLIVKAEDLRLVHIDQYFIKVEYIEFIFAADSWSGTPKVCEPDKCTAVGWFAEDKLPEKCVNAVRAVAASGGFSDELTYSITDYKSYEQFMGEPFKEGNV